MENRKRETTQSIAVSAGEKRVIDILAMFERVKPAAFAREIFYKGLNAYLTDRKLHASLRDEDIYTEALQLIESDEELSRIKAIVEYTSGLMDDAKAREAKARQRGEAEMPVEDFHAGRATVGTKKADSSDTTARRKPGTRNR